MSGLARWVSAMEARYDDARLKLRARFGTSRDLMIVPYIGHANAKTLYLRGRVLLSSDILPPAADDSRWQNLRNTIKRFNSQEIPYARVQATVNDVHYTVDCDEEGFFLFEITPPGGVPHETAPWLTVPLSVIETPIPSLDTTQTDTNGRVMLAPTDAQYVVISDLDDTIMRTNVLNVFRMLYNTLLRNAYTRLPFEGVAAFYRALQVGTRATVNPIFYVSSSPWNLYDVIMDFFEIRGIPQGPLYLRNIGIDRRSFLAKGHMAHKVEYIERLMGIYKHLPFVLIGDSGQKDARVYRELVRRHPDRIPVIYIRDVNRTRRAEMVERVAAEVRDLGSEMILVKDTVDAAQHAAEHGFISDAALPQIYAECRRDEMQTSLLERVLEE